MAHRQGCPFSDYEVQKIISLLKNTNLCMADIARAMGCVRSSVCRINKKYTVRCSKAASVGRQKDSRELSNSRV